ncbi:hypothetical protein ACW2Q0_19770 [Nocardia sp. R16R-3T]
MANIEVQVVFSASPCGTDRGSTRRQQDQPRGPVRAEPRQRNQVVAAGAAGTGTA